MRPYGNETKPGIVWTCPPRFRRRRGHDWPRDRKRYREWRHIERHLARHAARREIAFELAAGETMEEARTIVERAAFFGLSALHRSDVELERAVEAAETQHMRETMEMLEDLRYRSDDDDEIRLGKDPASPPWYGRSDDFADSLLLGAHWDDFTDLEDDR